MRISCFVRSAEVRWSDGRIGQCAVKQCIRVGVRANPVIDAVMRQDQGHPIMDPEKIFAGLSGEDHKIRQAVFNMI